MMNVAKRPERDESDLEELGDKLGEAKHERSEMLLTVWGKSEVIRGRIVELDANTRKVHVTQFGGEMVKIPFMDIMRAENSGA
ncbi:MULTISPECIES: YolD-like family protein [Paenibacillus]|uniref:YolD-like family protein n=1 Tax=Paenibacillus baimaensis TaxID=2982185 RepID=A0ABT2UM92_9BACL|nr:MULTISPECIES: YolD-like family protein [unclassified Paenibacillus]MCU6795697.1 YolD-like family protein [Paenibacillus sp. WQ 127069]